MSTHPLERAAAAALAWLGTQDSPESEIAAHESGTAESEEGARRWVRRFLDDQATDGSWGGDLASTARTLLTLRELREAASLREQDPGIGRALDWLRRRRGAPGAWTDGCGEERHARGICHHFAGGFFSPGPPELRLQDERLHAGAEVTGEADVRFAASVTALRAVLAWGEPGGDAALHLAVLRRLVGQESPSPAELGATALLEALQGLLQSPSDDDRAAAEGGIAAAAGRQRGDGSWVGLDPFHALEVFGRAARREIAPERATRALWHGARLLASTQQGDGSWGRDQGPRRALIAIRTFRQVGRTEV